MKTLALLILGLAVASSKTAAQEPNPTPILNASLEVCRADLKKWSAEDVGTLTIGQIYERMNMMVPCADTAKKAKKKDKVVMAYLYEFYRVHAELGNRSLDFIKRHELSAQFREEENGAGGAQSAQKADVEKR